MDDLKTVEDKGIAKFDPLRIQQHEGVARMRASLLACSMDDPSSVKAAINQVTVLRIYHQVTRIVRYLDLMDKLEDKLYASMECTIENAAETNPSTWMMLLRAQEKLQELMISSHKMLQPYLDLEEFSITEMMPAAEDNNPTKLMLDESQRDKIRNSAQAVLIQLNASAG